MDRDADVWFSKSGLNTTVPVSVGNAALDVRVRVTKAVGSVCRVAENIRNSAEELAVGVVGVAPFEEELPDLCFWAAT